MYFRNNNNSYFKSKLLNINYIMFTENRRNVSINIFSTKFILWVKIEQHTINVYLYLYLYIHKYLTLKVHTNSVLNNARTYR